MSLVPRRDEDLAHIGHEVSRFSESSFGCFTATTSQRTSIAIYGEYEALIEIDTLIVFRGSLPPRAAALVLEWAALHRSELRDDWQRARTGETLNVIEPLD